MKIISKSPLRTWPPKVFDFDQHTSLTHWGDIKMLGKELFPSSFQIKHEKTVIYIDPVIIEDGAKADFILLTHAHPDHYSPKDISQLLKEDTEFVCARSLTSKLGKFGRPIHEMKPGEKLELGNFTCEAVAAYNTKPAFLGFFYMHPKSRLDLGFVLTMPNDTRIYHTGDSHHIPEMNSIANIDIALLPIGGNNFTMAPIEAARYCNHLGPKVVVPMHYGPDKPQLLEEFLEGLAGSISVEKMR